MILVVVAMIGFGITSLMIGRAHNRVLDANHQLNVAHAQLSDANDQLESALKESESHRLLAIENMRHAKANAQRAELLRQKAGLVVDKLGQDYADKLKNIGGAEELREALLSDTLKYYSQFIELSENDPALSHDQALTYSKIGDISDKLGDRNKSLDAYTDSKQILEKLIHQEPENPTHKSDLALCLNNLGRLLGSKGNKTDAAKEHFGAAIEILNELVKKYPEEDQYQADLALVNHNLGLLNFRLDNLADARTDLEAACNLQESVIKRNPKNLTYKSRLAASYDTLSRVYLVTDRKKAIQSCSKAIEIQKQLVEENPKQGEWQSDLALTYHNLAVLQHKDGQDEKATASYRKAIDLLSMLVKRSPAVVKYRFQLAVSENNLGRLLSDLGQHVAAGKAFDDARRALVSLVHDYPYEPSYRSSLGGTLNNLGMTLEQLGRHTDAAKTYFEAIKHQHEAFKLAPEVERYRDFLSKQYVNYARTLRLLQRYDEAYEVIQGRKKLWKNHPEKLLGSASEMATLVKAFDRSIPHPTPEQSAVQKKISDAAIETLHEALDAGVLTSQSLQGTAFDGLRENQRFRMLTDKLNRS